MFSCKSGPCGFDVKVRRAGYCGSHLCNVLEKSSGLTERWTDMKFSVLFRIIWAQGIMSTGATGEKLLNWSGSAIFQQPRSATRAKKQNKNAFKNTASAFNYKHFFHMCIIVKIGVHLAATS